jgi:hypothetical protein
MGLWTKLRRLVAGGAASADPRTTAQELFAAEVETRMRKIPSVTSVRRKPGDFALVVFREGQAHTAFLGNVFAETRDLSPDERAHRLDRFVSSIAEWSGGDVDWEGAKEKLVPVVRASTAFISVGDDCTRSPFLARPFQPFLLETVAIDAENSFQYVTPGLVEKWGVDTDAVFAAAYRTAACHFDTRDIESYDPGAPYPIWHVARDDDYESSRLMLPGWLASFAGRVIGRPVAIIPERSKLIVGGDGDETCLRRLVETARREYEASTRAISTALYTVDGAGTVVPLAMPPGHSLANEVALNHVLLANAEYEAQQKPLQARMGDDVFVSSYRGLRRSDGSITSITTWSEGVESLLPKAQEIAFVVDPTGKSEVFQVPWALVERIAASYLVREPDLEPPRWRTRGWPDRAMLAQLRESASSA